VLSRGHLGENLNWLLVFAGGWEMDRMDLRPIFSTQCVEATLLGSLLSVTVLVALFFYLNRYTKRNYFTIWATAWLFYGLWLTLKLTAPNASTESTYSLAELLCIETSAVFLLWGSFRFLRVPTPQRLMGLFIGFLYVWSYSAPKLFESAWLVTVPCFALIGLASIIAGTSFVSFREHRRFVGASLLTLGFLLWGVYLLAYPFVQEKETATGAAFLFSAAVQLFIAVSMIILVLEEVRSTNDAFVDEIESVKAERQALEAKVQTSEQQMRTLFADATLKAETQRAYEELRAAHHKVVEQERLSVLGQIASGMAHDINNALTPLIGFSEILLDHEPRLPGELIDPLKYIRKAGKDIESIVGRVRQFYRGRSEHETFGKINLNCIIQDAVQSARTRWLEQTHPPGISMAFALHLDNTAPEIEGSEPELLEVINQLLLNAIDATPEGGTIEILSELVDSHGGPVGIESGPCALVEVRDHGIGMDATTRKRCIEPFFSTKRGGHSGLGLSLVYGAVQRHEGSMEITSEPSEGTAVRLFFPTKLRPSCPRLPAASTAPIGRLRVLCIDDEPLVRRLLKDVLEIYGHNVEVVDSGRAGIAAFQKAHSSANHFHVVITDLGMPDLDGRQVVLAIKRVSPETPMVALTAWATMLDPNDPLIKQVEAVLQKPLSMAQLEAVLRRVGPGMSPCQRELDSHPPLDAAV
jgi:signal transduction histidine kinase/ActR/RegA family two-component response regulator